MASRSDQGPDARRPRLHSWYESPFSTTAGVRSQPSRGWLRENLEQALPFLLAGGTCLGAAVWLHATASAAGPHHLALWTLLAAIGGTLGGGGVALSLVEEAPETLPADSDPSYVRVERSEWERLLGQLPAGSPDLPEWSEGPPEPPVEESTASLTVDDLAVAEASSDLLAPAQAESPAVEVASAVAPGTVPPRAGVAPEGGGGSVAPPAEPGDAPGAPPAPWNEAPIRELEDVLQELAARGPSPRAPGPRRMPTLDRCIGCGAPAATYSEQTCTICDRPMCDACLERSIAAGRPTVCPNCAPA